MKTRVRALVLFLALTARAFAQESSAPSGVNLAVVAQPSASYTFGDTSVTALNDGNEARSSRDRRRGSYGNWPRRDTQWVQYDWSQPISTKQIEVYWWDDPQGPLIGGRRTRWHVCPCCVGNIPRTLLMIPTWTYVKGKDGIYVNLFIGSTINVERVAGTDVEMVQKTDYPWDGKAAITVNPKQAKKFSVFVRVPDRKTSELYSSTPEIKGLKSFSVNGKSTKPKIQNGYAVVSRNWKAGDKIELELPLEAQRIKSDEKIVTNKGLVALRYGPLIYNVERADQQDINGVISSEPLTTEWRGDLLQGVKVIKGTWADGSPLIAIPNYARNNRLSGAGQPEGGSGRSRGEAGSMVWIKDQE